MVGAVLVVLATVVGIAGCGQAAVTSPTPSAVSGQPSPTQTASQPASSSTVGPGGPAAEALIRTLRADPFIAHVEETTVARTTTRALAINVTAKAVGDVSGMDVALHVTGTGNGPAVDQELVAVGDTVWIRRGGTTTWEVHPRSAAASAIDGVLATIRLIDDPSQLVDVGVEEVDGRQVHHLTAAGSIAYSTADGVAGAYDRFEIWATADGVPVLAKGAFSAALGTDSVVGNVDIRYSQVGGPITIAPPAGAPTLTP